MGRWDARDITGERFHLLTVVRYAGKDKHQHKTWECLCDCGNTIVVTTSNLNGTTHSCGCLRAVQFITHGMASTRIYQIWADMKTRCDNPDNPYYSEYGGRGITYDPKWSTFEGFYEDMQEGYADNLTLDREEVDGNYNKENCRWATLSVQNHNRRKMQGTSSKYVGVCLDKRFGCWYARLQNDHLGTFRTQEDAALAYDNASERTFGDRPNGTIREK